MLRPDQKAELFESIQETVKNEEGLDEAVLTKVVLIVECAVSGPGAPRALYHLTSDVSGNDLKTWEATGMLTPTLTKVLRNGS